MIWHMLVDSEIAQQLGTLGLAAALGLIAYKLANRNGGDDGR